MMLVVVIRVSVVFILIKLSIKSVTKYTPNDKNVKISPVYQKILPEEPFFLGT